jgi:membrane protein DedA with SNARE-associated domain
MSDTLQFVVHYGYALLFGWVMVEQGGLPIPATPLILAAGALAGQGRLSFPLVLLSATSACVCADVFWYCFGKRRGAVVLNLLCRIALEPDSCVRRTETRFAKWGERTLLICKFVPGMVAIPYGRFLIFEFIGALRWSSAYALLGFIFSKQLDRVARDAHLLGGGLVMLFLTGVLAYVLYRWRERERFIRQVKGDRITPDELKHELESGVHPVIIDLRHPLDVLTDPRTLPGALHISPEELEARRSEITREGEIVLFCT